MELFVILGGLALLLLILHLYTEWRERRSLSSVYRPDPLLLACLGDRAKADRLQEYERRRDPSISDEEARIRAWERLSADRAR